MVSITDRKEQSRKIGWLNWATVGISCEEEPVEWTAEDYDSICDNITVKRLSPEAVRTARREELELMYKLTVFEIVPVEQCWLVTDANPIGTKWFDITKATETEWKSDEGWWRQN